MKWFGRSWGAIALRFEEHAPTPVGTACFRCKTPIIQSDQGVIMPLVPLVGALDTCVMHLDCFLQSLHPCGGCHRCKPEKYPLH